VRSLAKSVWTVHECGYENEDILYGVFTSRRKMLTSIAEEFEELSMRWLDGKPLWGQFRRNNHVYQLTFTRMKLDKWSNL
jgi:hypothetical protein